MEVKYGHEGVMNGSEIRPRGGDESERNGAREINYMADVDKGTT